MRLGSRALEILIALIERPGELVSKSELMARVWPDTFVEDGNLKVQVAGLRRALGDSGGSNRYLATIPGRGYRFVAPVTRIEEASLSALRAIPEAMPDLPAPMTPMVDRADSVAALTAHLPHQRFITVAGPGGIGKTTVALAVARRLAGSYGHGVRFVDLAPLLDPGLVPGALAAGLGLETRSGNRVDDAIAALRGRQMLLVLDNCEHVIEAAAALAVEVLHHAPGVQILATSREPLRVEGEHVHRLPPLACPPASARLTAAQALGFPAVQLFVERAAGKLGRLQVRRRGGFAGRRHLPQAGRRAARHRAGCGPHRRLRRARPRGAPARSSPAAHRRTPTGAAATPDAAGDIRLGTRAAVGARAYGPAAPRDLRRRFHAGGGERDRGERARSLRTRSSCTSPTWSPSR